MLKNKNINIEKIGVSKCELKNVNYFSQILIPNKIVLKESLPSIEQIFSIIIDPEIISMRIVNTIKGKSCEGQVSSGKKVLVQVKLNQKIVYNCSLKEHSIHVVENIIYKDISITVPEKIEGTNLELMLKRKLINSKVVVEEIVIKHFEERVITQDIYLFSTVEHIPTYELAVIMNNDFDCSDMYFMYRDGSNKKRKTFLKGSKKKKVAWSPSGKKIAFICDYEGSNMLYTLDFATNSIIKITDSLDFKSIKSFSWSCDSTRLIFSAIFKNYQQIFSMDVNTMEYCQLTYEDCESKGYKPKCNINKPQVAFLRFKDGITNMYISDIKGMDMKKLPYIGEIKDFDWSWDCKFISCIIKNKFKKHSIVLIEVENLKILEVNLGNSINCIKGIKFSPCGKYISFINRKNLVDNIYVYDTLKESLINITKKDSIITISNFIWQIDGNEIFYVSNEMGYFNIYSICLKNLKTKQITNNHNIKIELSYRPKIM